MPDTAKRRVLVCDCEGTMPLDAKALAKALATAPGGGEFALNTHLCRKQIANFEAAAARGEPLLVACTQEAPVFTETADEAGAEADLAFVNIRERAGWSDEAAKATPKILALIAEAMLEPPPTPSVTMASAGSVLIYGRDENAIEAAQRLAGRMTVTCVIAGDAEVTPPQVTAFGLHRGTITRLTGHLGAFEATVAGMAGARPSSRRTADFGDSAAETALRCDIVLDLASDTPLVTAPEKRDGYLRPDPGRPGAVERALFEIADLVGEFEKPRYVRFDAGLCAHSRSRLTGCTRCLDVCPAGAITSAGDHVAIDPFVCGGCGNCASVCPTGAASYDLPGGNFLFERLRTLTSAYREHGGKDAVLLVHDPRHGEAMIAAMARGGRGLPARVLPFAVNETTQIGLEFLAAALAYGAAAVRILIGPARRGETGGLEEQIATADTLLAGLGYGAGRIALIEEEDPDAVEAALYGIDAASPPAPGNFLALGGKRSILGLALGHLHDHAPAPADVVALPQGAAFGAIEVDRAGCTLCLSCVGACPTGALVDNPDSPQLRFVESACVQCGLCRVTCPEKVISLTPRYNFASAARGPVVLHEEAPFECVSCGKPFATRSAIERMVDKLQGHSMFQDERSLNRLRMCPDCRVIDMANATSAEDPTFGAAAPRRRTRTAADYPRAEETEPAATAPPKKH
jgi:ferredoxin